MELNKCEVQILLVGRNGMRKVRSTSQGKGSRDKILLKALRLSLDLNLDEKGT